MRVAVLGAGYAGVALARRLEESLPVTAELTLVDESGHHLVQHELHRVVRRPDLRETLRVPLAELFDRADVVEDRVEAVDPDAGVAELADGGELSFDAGAVALGADTAFHGLADVREHATPLKRVEHADRIRRDFLDVCEDGGRTVVGGAGLSGVQVAGELAALADERGADPRITLLEQADRVAPQFGERFGTAVGEALERAGVEVLTGERVTGADEEGVEVGDGRLACDQFVWTGGITAPAALGDERPVVRADLRLGDRTVGLGDAVRVVDADGEAVPASAQAAVRQAPVAATNVERLLEGGDGVFDPRLERFHFESPGWLVSVGDDAVAQVGGSVLSGAPARALKASVGAGYLTGVGAVENAIDVVNSELGLTEAADDGHGDVDGAEWGA